MTTTPRYGALLGANWHGIPQRQCARHYAAAKDGRPDGRPEPRWECRRLHTSRSMRSKRFSRRKLRWAALGSLITFVKGSAMRWR